MKNLLSDSQNGPVIELMISEEGNECSITGGIQLLEVKQWRGNFYSGWEVSVTSKFLSTIKHFCDSDMSHRIQR